jgi:hypothetical protein
MRETPLAQGKARWLSRLRVKLHSDWERVTRQATAFHAQPARLGFVELTRTTG